MRGARPLWTLGRALLGMLGLALLGTSVWAGDLTKKDSKRPTLELQSPEGGQSTLGQASLTVFHFVFEQGQQGLLMYQLEMVMFGEPPRPLPKVPSAPLQEAPRLGPLRYMTLAEGAARPGRNTQMTPLSLELRPSRFGVFQQYTSGSVDFMFILPEPAASSDKDSPEVHIMPTKQLPVAW